MDYCSQLYFPHKSTYLERIENLQRIITRKFPQLRGLDYWQRLQKLKMNSQERRMKRYRALSVWTILEGISPNCGLEVTFSERRGREVMIPPVRGKGKIQSLRESSFQVHGPRIFNSLPRAIRNLQKISIDDFKEKLDVYLETIPDEPKLHNYVPSTCCQNTGNPSNSIIDHAKADRTRRPG